jgi:hypothetical protein
LPEEKEPSPAGLDENGPRDPDCHFKKTKPPQPDDVVLSERGMISPTVERTNHFNRQGSAALNEAFD